MDRRAPADRIAMRRAVTAFLRLCLRLFFRRIEFLGMERVPDGAVIFAVNHPNGLVDPLFLLCFAPKPVSFLAKAPLWRYPVIGWIVRAMDTIPVMRREEGVTGSVAEANAEMFRRAREVLQRGGGIAIFPEGTTHDDPQLRELKTGAARIALGANVEDLMVVPTGIYYTAKHVFRSSALVSFGEPIRMQPSSAAGDPPAEQVDALTAAIDAGLDAVTLQAESHAALDLIARAEDIFSSDGEQPVVEEFDLRRRFLAGYHYLCRHDAMRLEKLHHAIVQFESELRRANLDVHALEPRVDALRLFRVFVLLPLAIVGAIVHWPAFRVIDFLSRRIAKSDKSVLATIKVLGAMMFYPLTYIALAVWVGWWGGIVPAIAVLLIAPVLGFIALRVLEETDEVIGDLRALAHRAFRRYGHAQLIVRRAAIREEMLNVAREMERASARQ